MLLKVAGARSAEQPGMREITNAFEGAMCRWHMFSTDRSGSGEALAKQQPVDRLQEELMK